MEAQKCLEILREIKDVAFATVDRQGKPQVRMIDVMLVQDEKLYFCTARGKAFYHELMTEGQTAVAGMNKDYQMVRLGGRVKQPEESKAWIDRIFQENPSMNAVYPGESRYILEPFYMDGGQMEFFDLGKTPVERQSFVWGKIDREKKGFRITDQCVECGICRESCPQQCILKGSPYVIRQNHCLRCGLCYEKCPVQAVESEEI